jgi:hypothetical protein
MTMPVDRERDRRSLQDLAKMALTPPPPSVKSQPSGVQRAVEAKKDDSGIVDLAAAAQSDPGAETRAKATPLATSGLFDDEPASVRPGPLSGQIAQQPAPSLPPMPASLPPQSISSPLSVPVAPVAATASASQPVVAKKKSGGGVVIALVVGGVVALSAAAAGTFVVMKHRAQNLAALTTKAPDTVAPRNDAPKPVETVAQPTTPAPDGTLDPNALPTANAGGTKVAVAPKGLALKNGAPKDAPPPAAKPDEPAKLATKDLPKQAEGPAGDLGNAMKKEVGDQDKKPTPAAGGSGDTGFAPGSVPQKPSQGAVTGAIGAVLPAARACLGPDDPISRAAVTFGSNGNVTNVSVSGGAAGKSAEGCIRNALMKARVAPFAEASYTAPITIRH